MMTNCPVCQRDTSPVKIGGQHYCSVCGTPVHLGAPVPTPKRLSLDLSPRNRGPQAKSASAEPAADAPKAHTHHAAAAATAMHQRVKASKVLDLREQKATPEVAPPAHQIPAAPPKSTAHERHLAHLSERMQRAKQVERSPLVNKFDGPRLPSEPRPEFPIVQPHPEPPENFESTRELPPHAITHHQALTKLVPAASAAAPTSTHSPSPARPWRPHLGLSPDASRVGTTIAAVAIMAGYIWVQNYPKLALQNASSQAGLTASLPSYLPSSYTLKNTDTKPGVVTLTFNSPSAGDALKIDQRSTSWDSSSLLDNYVAKAADDYATVQGQGLTIYLFNNNQAAWVNHGIWYSIAGAGRLSREQILKIAYSL